MIAENILDRPDEPRFRELRLSNRRIKREIVEPAGVLQYAIEVTRSSSHLPCSDRRDSWASAPK